MADDTIFLPDYVWRQYLPPELLPDSMKPKTLILRNRADIGDLSQMTGGRAAMPFKPVTLYGPDGATPIVIVTAGVTETAEVEELAIAAYEKAKAKVDAGKPMIDFDEIRAKRGLPLRHQFSDHFKEALRNRMDEHRRNPISDPAPVRCDIPKGNVFPT